VRNGRTATDLDDRAIHAPVRLVGVVQIVDLFDLGVRVAKPNVLVGCSARRLVAHLGYGSD
jgi:hypothetical protein